MKTCSKCKIPKEDSAFANKTKGRLQPHCRECNSIRIKEHYKNNKQYYLDKNEARRKRLISWFQEYKSTLKCEICNEATPCCLDFHHTDPAQKDFLVSQMANNSHSEKAILKEISKCVVLCSNCHRKIHAEILVLSP